MEETILTLAKKCGEKLPDLRELEQKNEEIKKAMGELGIPVLKTESMQKQKQYCEKKGLPLLCPDDGICFFCRKKITDRRDKIITCCEHCNYSFCD